VNGFRLPEWTTDPFVFFKILPNSHPGESEKWVLGKTGHPQKTDFNKNP
jgi:hypothetical protein